MAEDNVKKIRDLNDFTSVNPMTTGDHLVVASSEGTPSTNKATIKDVVGLYLESSSGAGKWSDGTTAGDIYYSNGNVGIGTTDPNVRLVVSDNHSGDDVAMRVWNTSTADNSTSSLRFTNTTSANYDHGFIITGRTPNPYMQFGVANAITAMHIDSTGNVGIGTTNPSAKLEIAQSDGFANDGIILNYSPSTYPNTYKSHIYHDGDGSLILESWAGAATLAGDILLAPNGGSVGIGTTDPGAKLDIAGDDDVVHSRIENTSIDASSFAASVINGHLSAILQLTSRSSGTDAKSFNIASQGGRLTIDVISDDGQTATRLMDIDASGNLRIKGTLEENSSF
jgi:hypothetical protein